jgi:hypothetical protein
MLQRRKSYVARARNTLSTRRGEAALCSRPIIIAPLTTLLGYASSHLTTQAHTATSSQVLHRSGDAPITASVVAEYGRIGLKEL